jgi:hypothetical protein
MRSQIPNYLSYRSGGKRYARTKVFGELKALGVYGSPEIPSAALRAGPARTFEAWAGRLRTG